MKKWVFFCSVFWGPVLNWLFFLSSWSSRRDFLKKGATGQPSGVAHGAQMAHRSRASSVGGVTTTYVVKNVCCWADPHASRKIRAAPPSDGHTLFIVVSWLSTSNTQSWQSWRFYLGQKRQHWRPLVVGFVFCELTLDTESSGFYWH